MVLISQRDQCFGPKYNVIFSSFRNFKPVLFNHFNALLESNVHVSKKANAAVVVEKKVLNEYKFSSIFTTLYDDKIFERKKCFSQYFTVIQNCAKMHVCFSLHAGIFQELYKLHVRTCILINMSPLCICIEKGHLLYALYYLILPT